MRREGIQTKIVPNLGRSTRSVEEKPETDPKKWKQSILQRYREYRRALTAMGMSHLLTGKDEPENEV